MKPLVATTALFLLVSSTACWADWYLGLEVGPRFNTGRSISEDGSTFKFSYTTNFGVGVNAMTDVAEYLRLEFGAAYNQRGFAYDFSVFGSNFHTEMVANYFDLNAGLHWYFLGTEKERVVQPHVFCAVVPGFYLSGKVKLTTDNNNTAEEPIEDGVEWFHFAIRTGAGIDFQLSDNILLGVKAAFEPGLTDFTKKNQDTNEDDVFAFTSIPVSVCLTARF